MWPGPFPTRSAARSSGRSRITPSVARVVLTAQSEYRFDQITPALPEQAMRRTRSAPTAEYWPLADLRPARRTGLLRASSSPIAFVSRHPSHAGPRHRWLGAAWRAVLLELPLVLTGRVVTAARMLRRWPSLTGVNRPCLAMGRGRLRAADAGRSCTRTASPSARTLEAWIASLDDARREWSPGLAGQIAFALIPLGRRR